MQLSNMSDSSYRIVMQLSNSDVPVGSNRIVTGRSSYRIVMQLSNSDAVIE